MSNRAQDYMNFVRSQQEVTLPSGVVFRVKKPSNFWFATQTKTLPVLTPEELKSLSAGSVPSPELIERNVKLNKAMLQEHVLEPKIVDEPNYEAGELGFNDLLPEDTEFLIAYMTGTVDAKGSSITPFSRKPVSTESSAA